MEINLGIVATVCSILFGYLGYTKGQKDENKKLGKTEGTLKTDIEYIKKRTDEVLLEQKDTNKNISALNDRVTRVETRLDNVVEDFKDCKNNHNCK